MPKLLQINSTANITSTGRIAEQVGALAIEEGWDSYLAYGRTHNHSQSQLLRIGSQNGVYFHAISSFLFDNHGLSSWHATKVLIEQIKTIAPDIIHLHNLHGYYLNYRILFDYLASSGIPVVWTLHDCWAFTGHCSHYSDIDCRKWQTLCENCPKSRNYPRSLFIDRSLRNYQTKKKFFNSVDNLTIVPVSKWLENEVKKSFLKHHRVRSIFNGVDIMKFHPSGRDDVTKEINGLTGKKVLLGVATAWGPRKGWQDYIRLSQMLSEEYKIVMVGVTNKQAKELPPNILTIERTESVEMLADLYSMADVVLNLSDEESFGLTTAEGLACGTPSIVYNCTASPELITKETGLVIEKGNLGALYNAIHFLTSDGKQHYSEECRKRAVEFYDKDKNFKEYIRLYNHLITSSLNEVNSNL